MNDLPLLRPGWNCWRIEHADRVCFLVDGADYFNAFRQTVKNAQRSVLIIGWDIDSRFELERDRPPDGLPTRLGGLPKQLVQPQEGARDSCLDAFYPAKMAIIGHKSAWLLTFYRLELFNV